MPLFDRAALDLGVELLPLNVGGKLRQARFEARAFFLQLDLLGGEFFQADDIALFLEIESVDLVARASQLLHRGESL